MHLENLFLVLQAVELSPILKSKVGEDLNTENVTKKSCHMPFNGEKFSQLVQMKPNRTPPGRARGHTRT